MEGWELACTIESDREQRISLNKRGIVLKGELGEDGEVPIRVGQCWELDNKVYDILGYNENRVEVMEWESAEKKKPGGISFFQWMEEFLTSPSTVRFHLEFVLEN